MTMQPLWAAGSTHSPGYVLRLDYQSGRPLVRLGKFERLSSGALRIPARLTRTGVLEYPGGVFEYRPREEVFAPESLATLRSAPVVIHHPPGGEVTRDNWKQEAVGHIESVRPEGHFIAGDLIISDRQAIEMIERGDLVELSPGYGSALQISEGTSPEGERYNRVQRNIRYNHLALLPAGMGRSGPEVKLRIDSNGVRLDSAVEDDLYEDESARLMRRIDSIRKPVKLPFASEEELQRILALARSPTVRAQVLERHAERRDDEELDESGTLLDEQLTKASKRAVAPYMKVFLLTKEEFRDLEDLAMVSDFLEAMLAAPQRRTDNYDSHEERLSRQLENAWRN